jgi:hypothetical protein
VDIFGTEVQTGHPAIIENQLEPTDHGHLGQLITYASGLKAGVIVWIARRFRDEHREALVWLNEISPENVNFFGVELEILEIAGNFAPNFKLVAEPNSWQKASRRPGGTTPATVSDRNLAYQAFFTELLDEAKVRAPGITAASKTQPVSWFWFSSGKSGVHFSWAFVSNQRFRIELSIDTPDRERNVQICELLCGEIDVLQQAVGQPVLTDIQETRRQVRLEVYPPFEVTIDSPPETLERLKEWAVPTMISFVNVLRPRLKAMP